MVGTIAAGMPITYSASLPQWLHQLNQHFQLVWATAWGADANAALAPLFHLEPLPTIDLRAASAGIGQTWKLPAVQAFVKDRPFAWVDDELGGDGHAWAERREASSLLIDTNPARGISHAVIAELLAFAEALAG
jgi:hypothetical protein